MLRVGGSLSWKAIRTAGQVSSGLESLYPARQTYSTLLAQCAS
jgi:hypothetical protein